MVWLNTPTKLWLTRYTTKPRQPAKQNKLKSIEFQPTNNTKEMKELTHSPKGAQKQTEEETYSKTPHKNLETKIYKYFKLSNLNCYQNSTISCEAKILSDEILKFYKFSTKKLARSIAVLNTKQIRTLIMTLSNHNSLNYHLEKIGLYYDPYCDYCTKFQKGNNAYWQTNCLETASHILLECPHFSKNRYKTYQKVKLTPKIQSKHSRNSWQKQMYLKENPN